MTKFTPVQIYKQGNAPDQTAQTTPDNPIPWVDDLWIDITAHLLKQCTSINPYVWVAIGTAGPVVTSVNGLTGAVTLAAGSNITITPAGNTLTFSSTLAFGRGGTVLSPNAPINIIVWDAPFSCTVTAVKGYVVGATGSTVNARKNGTLNHLASDLTLGSADTWLDGGAVQNIAYSSGDKLEIMLTGISGTPTELAIQVNYTRP